MATSISDQKSSLFSTISSYKTLSDKYPVFTDISRYNNSNDQIAFAVDLFSVLGSENKLKDMLTKIVFENLDFIELSIKQILKEALKNNIACNINPSVIGDVKNSGVWFRVEDIDIQNKLKTSPLSKEGEVLYFDVSQSGDPKTSMLRSRDLDAFIYAMCRFDTSLPAPPTGYASGVQGWYQYPQKNELPQNKIAMFTFCESNCTLPGYVGDYSNLLNIRIHNAYTNVNRFNSDYIDSLSFFDTTNKYAFAAEIVAEVFGSLNIGLKLSREQIFLQKQIENILDRLSQCVSNEDVDDSFFSFDNTTYNAMMDAAELEKLGESELGMKTGVTTSVSIDDIKAALEGLSQTVELQEQKDIFTNAIDSVLDKALANNPEMSSKNKFKIQTNIVKALIEALVMKFLMQMLSPKVTILVMLNLRLLGLDKKYDAISFLKDNLNLITEVISGIKDIILDMMMNEIKNMATDLAASIMKKIAKDQIIKFKQILLGLNPLACYVNKYL
jgi:hypothetical protein